MQVRSAYRRKGWAFTDPQGIEQCAQEGFSKALQEQAGEGCHMWGAISINKVCYFTAACMAQMECLSCCNISSACCCRRIAALYD